MKQNNKTIMKLVSITAIKEFEQEIKKILKASEVKTYSYRNVTGFRDSTQDAIGSNWFATEMNENESILFYAFVPMEKAENIFELVEAFNAKEKTLSNIHIAIINIEKSN